MFFLNSEQFDVIQRGEFFEGGIMEDAIREDKSATEKG